MAMIKEILKKLELSDREIAVYAVISKYKKATPAFVSMHTKISRPTVYNIAKQLVSRGLLVEDLGGKTLAFTPTPPKELHLILRNEEKELEERKKLLSDLGNELELLKSSTTYPVPKIRFVEQDRLSQFLYSETPVWNESVIKYDSILWGFQDTTFVDQYHEWIEWYWENSDKRIEANLLSNSAPIEEKMKERMMTTRHIKPWDKGMKFSATTWVFGDYLVMIVTDKEPFYLVEIYDKRMGENYREIFRNLWALVK